LGIAGARSVKVEVVVQLCKQLWGRERKLGKKGRVIFKQELFGSMKFQ
jgi:hypothetical protein